MAACQVVDAHAPARSCKWNHSSPFLNEPVVNLSSALQKMTDAIIRGYARELLKGAEAAPALSWVQVDRVWPVIVEKDK
jgi:hypothetical protein